MKALGIIPARYASTRFPGKPLADIAGKSMIQRVVEQARKCEGLSNVVVATDDDRIADHVRDFGGIAAMTDPDHPSGTDRCREALDNYVDDIDVVINIQGDEPFIQPEQISLVLGCFDDDHTQLATLVKAVSSQEELQDPNKPKVVVSQDDHALYFSRSPIPHLRGKQVTEWLDHRTYFQHIGIYGYRASTLRAITQLAPSPLEQTEALEQLRWLENGYRIRVAQTPYGSDPVDTPEDLAGILSRMGNSEG